MLWLNGSPQGRLVEELDRIQHETKSAKSGLSLSVRLKVLFFKNLDCNFKSIHQVHFNIKIFSNQFLRVLLIQIFYSSSCEVEAWGETKTPSAVFHSVAPPDFAWATISSWPLIGRLNCCPDAAKNFSVPLCFSFTAPSRRHLI